MNVGRFANESFLTEHVSESSQYVSELDVSETTCYPWNTVRRLKKRHGETNFGKPGLTAEYPATCLHLISDLFFKIFGYSRVVLKTDFIKIGPQETLPLFTK